MQFSSYDDFKNCQLQKIQVQDKRIPVQTIHPCQQVWSWCDYDLLKLSPRPSTTWPIAACSRL